MKIFAHYLTKDGVQYRWRTILQFGNSWDVIGSVIMINPGSAAPLRKIEDNCILEKLHTFSDKYDWFEFSLDKDKTIPLVEQLFIKRNNGKALDGVIQIFNLFNIRNANLDDALNNYNKSEESVCSTLNDDIEAMRRYKQYKLPIYIGWGKQGTNPRFREKAIKIFQFVLSEMEQDYLRPKFEDNKFYHPLYLLRYGKNKPNSQCQYLLNAFCQNSQNPEYICTTPPKVKIDKARIAEEIVSKIDLKPYDEKNHRYFLSDNIEITITHKDNGCVELRPIHNINLPDEYINSLKGKLLEKGYNVDVKVWIGRKLFTQFRQNSEDIVNSILKEINELKDLCAPNKL